MYRRSRIANAYTRNGRITNPTELNVLENVLETSATLAVLFGCSQIQLSRICNPTAMSISIYNTKKTVNMAIVRLTKEL